MRSLPTVASLRDWLRRGWPTSPSGRAAAAGIAALAVLAALFVTLGLRSGATLLALPQGRTAPIVRDGRAEQAFSVACDENEEIGGAAEAEIADGQQIDGVVRDVVEKDEPVRDPTRQIDPAVAGARCEASFRWRIGADQGGFTCDAENSMTWEFNPFKSRKPSDHVRIDFA